jgi:hypothetical protein
MERVDEHKTTTDYQILRESWGGGGGESMCVKKPKAPKGELMEVRPLSHFSFPAALSTTRLWASKSFARLIA